MMIIYNVGSMLWQQQANYTTVHYWKNYPVLEQQYLDSQYINKHPKWVGDEIVFSYAGGALIKGTNPVLVIPDAPPLGKYLIGISILLFDNPHIIIGISGIASLVLLYMLSKQVLKDKFIALFPTLLYSSEPLFKNQFVYSPLMDLFQLVFLLSYFYCINKAFLGKKQTTLFFILASMLLGFFIATKFFVSGITILIASVLWTLLNRNKKKLLTLLATIPISVGILLASYARVFAFGYSFREFLGIQKWVFLYHQGQIILPLSVWPLLLLNRWYVWYGNNPVISDAQWLPTWPIITIVSFVTIGFYLFKKIERRREVEILMLWITCYLGFLSFGQIFARYFVILLPILYIIATYGTVAVAKQLILTKKKKHKK